MDDFDNILFKYCQRFSQKGVSIQLVPIRGCAWEKGILTVLGPAHYGYEMDTISLYVKVGTNGNVYQAMNYLVHNAQSTVHPPLIQVSPAKLGYHIAHR